MIQYPGKDKTHVYHVNMLKPYYQRSENVNLLCLEQNSEDEDDIPNLECKTSETELLAIFKKIQSNSRLSEDQRKELTELIRKYLNIFSTQPGCTNLTEHDIELESESPVCAKPYRISPRQPKIFKNEVEKMLQLKVIEPGESDFSSHSYLLKYQGKKQDPVLITVG